VATQIGYDSSQVRQQLGGESPRREPFTPLRYAGFLAEELQVERQGRESMAGHVVQLARYAKPFPITGTFSEQLPGGQQLSVHLAKLSRDSLRPHARLGGQQGKRLKKAVDEHHVSRAGDTPAHDEQPEKREVEQHEARRRGSWRVDGPDRHRDHDQLPRLMNTALLICAAALLCVPHMPVTGLTVHVLPGSEWRIWAALGAALTLFGLLFTVWARIYLGRNWSGVAAIKADHELVVGGPYQWVRHPIYSGLALAFLGTAIAIGQWRGMLAVELALLAFGHRILVEERFMRQQFGAVYEAYAQRVRALVPGLI
jgi:protein-S-isoprenylcysteine O-methyltransferase Ste14